jgi:hypothetical protein
MQLMLTPEEARLLLGQLAQRIQTLDAELVHTDKRDLQRSLAGDLKALQALTDKIRSEADDAKNAR